MAWCPLCKNEYRKGIKTCADCGCDLVEVVQQEDLVPILFGDGEKLESLKKYLEYNNFKDVEMRLNVVEQQPELFVRASDRLQAYALARVFFEQEALREQRAVSEAIETEEPGTEEPEIEEPEIEEPEIDEPKTEVRRERAGLYSSSTQSAQENRNSAWAQLLVGGIGLLFLILCIVGIIPFNVGNPYLFYGGMGSLFIFFIGMGMVCLRRAKVFDKSAESENSLKEAITTWYQQNLTAESVDAEFGGAVGIPEEMLYFQRAKIIKDKLNHQFMNLDQVFLEHMIDNEIYDYIYTEKER